MFPLFPFSKIRESQNEFMKDIYDAVHDKKHLVAHAPTGIGKTSAALSVALDYALREGKTVFFITPRHSQHHMAIETLRKIREKSKTDVMVTDLIGKKWFCSVLGIDELTTGEFSDYCRIMVNEERCKYYNATRTNSRTLTKKGFVFLNKLKGEPLHSEEVKELMDGHCCPYEILTEHAKKSDVIIADYFHVFSPLRASLFTKIKKDLEDSIIIVDEAHNLPGRIRDLMSQKLTTTTLKYAEKEAKTFGFNELQHDMHELAKIIDQLKKEKLQRESESFVRKDVLSQMIESRIEKIDTIIDDLLNANETVLESRKKSLLGSVAKFLTYWGNEDEGYARILQKATGRRSGKEFASLVYSCLDPTFFSKDVIEQSHSTILMSGTLSPMEMYRDLLGFDISRTKTNSYSSPFPKKNRLNLFITNATTKYSKRNMDNYNKIAEHVATCANKIPGNVAVFFPSYKIRDIIYDLVKNRIIKEIILESQDSNKADRRKLYNRFVELHEKGSVLLGVQGASFAEGIDLPGKHLNGVVVVGIPLERPNLENKALIDYYDIKFNRGWDYGYIYPAMIRSIQAAGRCIRSETDKGVVVFIDERFLWGNYRKVFPSDMQMKITINPEREIKEFFK
ncbi:ATP-dependent DNA helicase [Candidatus Aenigmatarchaeota archaeon]